MNIWKLIANEGYNNAFLIDSNGKQCFDKPSELIKTSPTYKKMVYLQKLEDELKEGK